MPAGTAIKSSRQWNLMQAARAGKSYVSDISPNVAEKLIHETSPARRRRFAKQTARRGKRRKPRLIGI